MEPTTSRQFFALLRAGLWGQPAPAELFAGGADWAAIQRAAVMQAVSGLVADGINSLPAAMMPPSETARRLYVAVEGTRRANLQLDSVLAEVVTMLGNNGIDSILLKGQGLARDYIIPEHRMCGDIDLYTGCANYRRSCELLESFGKQEGREDECEKHFHFTRKGCTIEIHKFVNVLPDPFADRRLQRWAGSLLGDPSGLRQIEICGSSINLPPVAFDAVFILFHIADHLVRGGIGLRQICDWCRFLHVHNKEIDRGRLAEDLRTLKLMNIWQTIGWIAVNRLGLPEEEMPFYSEASGNKALRCLEIIMLQGNFGDYGHSRKDVQRGGGFLRRKFLNSTLVIRQQAALLGLFPSEVLRFLPWYLLDGIRRLFKGRKS